MGPRLCSWRTGAASPAAHSHASAGTWGLRRVGCLPVTVGMCHRMGGSSRKQKHLEREQSQTAWGQRSNWPAGRAGGTPARAAAGPIQKAFSAPQHPRKMEIPPGADPTLAACQALSPSQGLSFFICTVKGLDQTDSPKSLSGPNMPRCREVPVSCRHASIKPGMLPGGGGIWVLREREKASRVQEEMHTQ